MYHAKSVLFQICYLKLMGYEYYVGIDEVMRCRDLRKFIRGICEIS